MDLLAFGGDISISSAGRHRARRARITETDIPTLSTVGNHDWLFLDQKPCDAVRQACAGRMEMLHGSPDFDPTLRWPTIDTMKGQPVLMADPDWPVDEVAGTGVGPGHGRALVPLPD